MKYDMCFGLYSRKPCPHYHPSNMYDDIHMEMSAYAQQRCWCMKADMPVRDVCITCSEFTQYDFEIHIKGKIDLHIADSMDDFVKSVESRLRRKWINLDTFEVEFKEVEEDDS